uniref:Uncharacterized protein n=1 Tax=Knipowitschia caucasica TaxID=637954 RepID=A0AAV2L4M3_KNICA
MRAGAPGTAICQCERPEPETRTRTRAGVGVGAGVRAVRRAEADTAVQRWRHRCTATGRTHASCDCGDTEIVCIDPEVCVCIMDLLYGVCAQKRRNGWWRAETL